MESTTAVSIPAVAVRRASDHRFYVGSAVVSLAVALVSFVPGLIDGSARRGPLTPIVAIHAIAFSGWLVFYLAQTLLASSGNLRLHRRLGTAGVVLAAVMIVGAYQATIEMVRRGFDLSGDLERLGPVILNTTFQLIGILAFGGLILAAVLNRRRPEVHKRLMWLATGSLLGAPIAHAMGHFGLPGPVAALANVVILAANPIHDRIVHGRTHPVSLWGSVGFFLFANGLVALSGVPAWQSFVRWLAQ